MFIYSRHHTKMTFFWTKLLAGQGLSNISLKSVSVLYGNFSEKFPIIHNTGSGETVSRLGITTFSCSRTGSTDFQKKPNFKP